jgi:outer membrane protein OmpA-like peptidoglycan-associated protein
MRSSILVAVLALAATLSTSNVYAQVSSDDIVEQLKPPAGLTRSITTRRIQIVPGKEADILDNKDLPKINLSIEFEYNSDKPTSAGQKQLIALADALRNPRLGSSRFLVAGHTDAKGSDDYNQTLSERRASAVKDFLARSGVDDSGLQTVGFGKRRLLDTASPESARNRRVEVVNLLN